MDYIGFKGKEHEDHEHDHDPHPLHPSRLKAWSVNKCLHNEVGVIVRINSLENVDTADKAIKVKLQRMAYRLFDDQNPQDRKLLAAVQQSLNPTGEYPPTMLSGVCPWSIVEDYAPKLRFGRVVGDTKTMTRIAWVDADVDPNRENDVRMEDERHNFTKLTVNFDEEMIIHLRDPAPAKSFPFDWHCYMLDVTLEPTEEFPSGVLRGIIDDSAGFSFKRWAAKKQMSLPHRRQLVRDADPWHDTWSFIDKSNKRKLLKHSGLRIDKSFVPDWKVYIHKNNDTVEDKDPWPYWLTTEETGEAPLAGLTFRFWMKREPHLYIWNALFPATVMELLGLLTFFLEPPDIGARQRSLFTLILVVYAIKFSSSQANPNVGYTTMYDVKFLTSLLFLGEVLVLQHLFLMVKEDFMSPETCENVALTLALITAGISNLAFWITALYEYRTKPEDNIHRPVMKPLVRPGKTYDDGSPRGH